MKERRRIGREEEEKVQTLGLGLVFRTRFSKTLPSELTPRVEEAASGEQLQNSNVLGMAEFHFVWSSPLNIVSFLLLITLENADKVS